ncbi:MAG: PEP-CTERM sorting domain-containing protein [Verrucomicrobia bacterium]|nr:PEP-CTERM sorting domain-containing protein [Verrucomicrobiota bacterium]
MRGLTLRYSIWILISVALCVGALPGWVSRASAHDGFIITEFADFTVKEFQHEDEDPFKGLIDLTVTNTGTEAWGDFHFEIFQIPGFPSVENVDFTTEVIGPDDFRPLMEGNLVSFVVDNDVVGATLDLYFYSTPVLPNQTVNFKVHTDNTTDQVSFFGLMVYPTPFPEPGTMALLGLGGAALLLRWRKKK